METLEIQKKAKNSQKSFYTWRSSGGVERGFIECGFVSEEGELWGCLEPVSHWQVRKRSVSTSSVSRGSSLFHTGKEFCSPRGGICSHR